ncbi:sulfite exporter TauE/SafE family protein [Nocardioides anomalus]|uniref:Probable membrane transporter protein n=1 Tax=Nocardioides anomalus TaxID=2712223 RepID=A0A6G6WJU8_9ACTN|nr:sulfite exporter TauE/SafE family protein [Nocardioides anomalus]QIG45476.1 sulfite exporter TauE/SafE family protein [Nocardioides anomalus]
MEPGTYLAIALAVFLGSAAQSLVGLGIGLFSAPVMTLLEPWTMPGSLIMLALVLPAVTLVRDHDEIDWPGLNWSLPSRLVGTGLGVWVVAAFSHRQLGVVVGLVVLLMVLLTWRVVEVPVNRGTLSAAGFVGGVTGTATSIGGPPFALLYQHRSAQQIRTTMAVYFLIGAGLSLAGLLVTGDLTGAQLRAALELAPAMLLGALAGAVSRRWLPASLVRPSLLVVSGASALVLLVRSLLG